METDGREGTKGVFLKCFSKHMYKHKTLYSNSILCIVVGTVGLPLLKDAMYSHVLWDECYS
jgi:hypothetical protein